MEQIKERRGFSKERRGFSKERRGKGEGYSVLFIELLLFSIRTSYGRPYGLISIVGKKFQMKKFKSQIKLKLQFQKFQTFKF